MRNDADAEDGGKGKKPASRLQDLLNALRVRGTETFWWTVDECGRPSIDRPGWSLRRYRINNNHPLTTAHQIEKRQPSRPAIDQLYPVRQSAPPHRANYMNADTFIGHQQVPHTDDRHRRDWLEILHRRVSHRIRNFFTAFPGSRICTAHAMHGSNERTIRASGKGFSVSSTVVPIRACSMGPASPRSSRGEAFHVVGTTAW